MPNLCASLQKFDLGHLRAVASLWGVELTKTESEAALAELCAALLDPQLGREIFETLPAEAKVALEALANSGGKMPWAAFIRRFGEVREVGPARRDREQVYLNPISPAEILFYRALLARAFFDTPVGPQEFAYIPDDFLPLIAGSSAPGEMPSTRQVNPTGGALSDEQARPLGPALVLGRPASPKEREMPLPATDHLLDDAVTFLAALRMNLGPPPLGLPLEALRALLQAGGVLVGGEPAPEKVRLFLETPRSQALALLFEAWKESETFNELRLMTELVCEGEWTNRPLAARRFLLDLLDALPKEKWWSLPAFLRAVKEQFPDFQRPAGDYDSWFIKRTADGVYLRGFEHWDEVDGALIRFLITGPLHWLGRVDLACAEAGGAATAFKVNERFPTTEESGKLFVTSDGRIRVPRNVPRVTRYLLARFCAWEEARADDYRYRVTPRSLKAAQKQGLKVGQLLSLLAKNAAGEIPPAFVKALKRWERNGSEARVEVQTILRLSRPEVLEELRRSKAGRFLGDLLGPTAVVIKRGALPKVLAALAEMGLLAEEAATEEDSRER